MNKVKKILLVDGWHDVEDVYMDSYEFCDDESFSFKGGESPLICSIGIRWTELVKNINRNIDLTHIPEEFYAPLTSILAVRY